MRHLVLALAIAAVVAGCSDRTPADTTDTTDTTAPVTTPTPTPPGDTAPPPGDTTPPVDDSTTTVPPRFQGNWAADAAACASTGHESHLMIGADRIEFHESSGTVKSVMSSGSELTIVASVTGEGGTRDATYRFRLSDDGNMLTDTGSGTSMVRHRC
jgi:hypothetical protein